MALDIKIEKRKLNFTDEKKEVYVATPDRNGVIDTEKMSKVIAKDTGARPAQIKMILSSLQENMMEWFEEGHGVRFDGLGSFLLSVKSKSADSADDAEVERVRITFLPNRELSRRVAAIRVNTVGAGTASGSAPDDTDGDTPGGSTGTGGSDNTGGEGEDFT